MVWLSVGVTTRCKNMVMIWLVAFFDVLHYQRHVINVETQVGAVGCGLEYAKQHCHNKGLS